MRKLSNRRDLLAIAVALNLGWSVACEPASTEAPSKGDHAGAGGDEDVKSLADATTSGNKADASSGSEGDVDSDDDASVEEQSEDDETIEVEPSADDQFFRVDRFLLKSPGVVLRPAGLEVSVTGQAQTGITDALVSDIDPDNNNDGEVDEGDGDGFVDLSLLVRFLGTESPASEAGRTTFGGGACPHPYAREIACGPSPELPFQARTASYTNRADCELDGTSHVAAGPCFITQKGGIMLTLPLLGDIPLEEGQVVGAWVDEGRGGIESGAIRGFLPQSVAEATKLGAELPPLAVSLGIKVGTPLAEFLPKAQRTTNSAGTDGWWFHIEFSAKPAIFDESAEQ